MGFFFVTANVYFSWLHILKCFTDLVLSYPSFKKKLRSELHFDVMVSLFNFTTNILIFSFISTNKICKSNWPKVTIVTVNDMKEVLCLTVEVVTDCLYSLADTKRTTSEHASITNSWIGKFLSYFFVISDSSSLPSSIPFPWGDCHFLIYI